VRREILTTTLLLTTAALAGCYRPAKPADGEPPREAPPALTASAEPAAPPRERSPRDAVRFYDLAAAYGLETEILDMTSGQRLMKDSRNEVVVWPGRDYLVINGAEHRLTDAIRWHEGVLYLPAESRAVFATALRRTPVPDVGHDPDLFDGSEPGDWEPAAAPAASARRSATRLPSAWRIDSDRRWRYIVIHHSATDVGDAESFHRQHAKKWQNGLGYHFVIGNGTTTRDGQVQVGPRWLRQNDGIDGAHAGNKTYNEYGVGVCLVGDFNQGRPTRGQLEALRTLCRALMGRYGIPADRIKLHKEVRRGHTDCPGDQFPMRAFLRMLR